jgi:hypothetical protein
LLFSSRALLPSSRSALAYQRTGPLSTRDIRRFALQVCVDVCDWVGSKHTPSSFLFLQAAGRHTNVAEVSRGFVSPCRQMPGPQPLHM